MAKPVDHVLIIGGGTAGWITAAYMAKKLGPQRPGGVQITLIESAEIGIIGVGEATIPTIQTTMRAIGIDEATFMKGSNATFKQGIRFTDWTHAPKGGKHSHYYHPFTFPRLMNGVEDLAPYWLLGVAGDVPFAEAVGIQQAVSEANRAPKELDDVQYGGPLNYAYHFDAPKLAELMKQAGKAMGVKHLLGNVEQVNLAEDGSISSVTTREHGELTAGLYIDCTGFAGALIGKALGVKFVDKNDVLFVDRATAIQVPYDHPDDPISSVTVATAHEAGWSWDIGLPERRGVGYVWSSNHTDSNRAEEVLRGYIGEAAEGLSARELKLRVGCREKHWVKNCVAIGLSGGFAEPLESTGIMLIETAAWMITRLFPRSGEMEETAALFNQAMADRYRGVFDFIKLHFCLTQRTDNDFWIDNTRAESIPDTLGGLLQMWKHRAPDAFDLPTVHDSFEWFNYQFILYGMGFRTDLEANRAAYPYIEQAKAEFERIRAASGRAVAGLREHRALVSDVYGRGFAQQQRRLAPAGMAQTRRVVGPVGAAG